jgi:hypothetical protein
MVGGRYVLEDTDGTRLALADIRSLAHSAMRQMPLLDKELCRDSAMLVMFEQDLLDGNLLVQPLCLVAKSGIVRLLY